MNNENHLEVKKFWFVVGISAFGLIYMVALTFFPVGEDNIRFADTSIGWVQGTVVTSAISYLLGGNPLSHKKPSDTITQVSENIVNNQIPKENE